MTGHHTLLPSYKGDARNTLELARDAGDLDEGLYPVLKRLNEHPGVATHYSCAGHVDRVEDEGHITGSLIFTLAPAYFNLLQANVFDFLMFAPGRLELAFKYWRDEEGELRQRVWLSVLDPPEGNKTAAGAFAYLASWLEHA